jgi:integrase
MGATARIFLQKFESKKTKQGLYPVKLVVTFNRKRRYYSLKDYKPEELEKPYPQEWLYLSEDLYNKAQSQGEYAGKKPTGEAKKIRNKFDDIEARARRVIDGLNPFSFAKFETKFYNQAKDWQSIIEALDEYIKELKETRRYGYAVSFQSTQTKLKEYAKQKKKITNLSFADITPSFLESFEQWLLDQDKSESTVGVYARNIRRLFNLAMQRHGINVEYPFGTPESGKYSPPKGEGTKTALSAQQMGLIATYKAPEDSPKEFYRDLFMFSFLGNGMNLADILRLKYKNIENGTITFIREKTKRKARGKKISVEITDRMQQIIDKWGNKNLHNEIYVFNVLNGDQSEDHQYYLIRQQTKLLNKYIKEIAKELEIKENVSSYTARHSFATIQKNSGVPVSYLKEALGHSDVSVTENYLKALDKDQRKKTAENLEKQIYGNNLKIS